MLIYILHIVQIITDKLVNSDISMKKIGWRVYIISILFTWLPLALLSLLSGTFFQNSLIDYESFSISYTFHFFWILVIPIAIVLMLWNYREFTSLRRSFVEQVKCKDINISYRNIFIKDFFYIVLPGTFIFGIWALDTAKVDAWWQPWNSNYVTWITFLFLCATVITIGVTCGSYTIRIAKWIDQNLKQTNILKVDIYNPDDSGGLGWIFKPFLHQLFICAPLYLIGFGIVINNVYFNDVSWKNPLVLFNMFWPTYFGPTWVFWSIKSTGIRKYLKEQKKILIKNISDSISQLLQEQNHKTAQYESQEKLFYMSKNLNEMVNFYDRVQKDFPVWPFPKRTLRFVVGMGPSVTFMSSFVVIINDPTSGIMKTLLSIINGIL